MLSHSRSHCWPARAFLQGRGRSWGEGRAGRHIRNRREGTTETRDLGTGWCQPHSPGHLCAVNHLHNLTLNPCREASGESSIIGKWRCPSQQTRQ